MIHQYNKHMGGVDLNDMLMSLYRIESENGIPILFITILKLQSQIVGFYIIHIVLKMVLHSSQNCWHC